MIRTAPSRCTGSFREEYLESTDWVAEPKLDGGRYQLHLEEDGLSVHLFSRRDYPRIDKAANVPHFAKPCDGLAGTILDGEIISSRAVFPKLTPLPLGETTGILNSLPAKAIARQEAEGKLAYVVFDILSYCGHDVRQKPLCERRTLMLSVIATMNNPFVVAVPQSRDKDGLFRSMISQGLEGTVIKNVNSPYGVNWVKMKRVADFSVIVSGFKPGQGKYAGSLGAVAVSVYENGVLREVGFASGMDDDMRHSIWKNRETYLGKTIDVSAQEVTKDGRLRHPRWLRERDDLDPKTLTFAKLLDDAEKARCAAKGKKAD
jgi:bifunctional non-homologous end joining protein LigD